MRYKVKDCLDVLGRTVIILIDVYYLLGGSFLIELLPDRKILVCCSFALFGVIICLRLEYAKYTKREVQRIIAMLGVSIVCLSVTGESTLLISSICILACVNADKGKLFWGLLIEKTAFLITSIVLSGMGIISTQSGSYTRLYSFIGDNVVFRRSLGFTNYNRLGMTVFELMTLYVLYVRQKQGRELKRRQYIVLFGGMFAAYGISGSRTAFFSEIVLLLILKLYDMGWMRKRTLKAMIMAVMIGGSCVFSAGIVFLHEINLELYQKLDDILQARLVFIYRFMLKFGIKIFGSNISDLTDFWGTAEARFDWISLDCGYAVMMIEYGVLATLLIIWMHFVYLYGRRHYVNPYVLCVMLAVCVYNISERVLVISTVNYSLLYLADIVKTQRVREEKAEVRTESV